MKAWRKGSPGKETSQALERVPCNLCGSQESRIRFEAMDGWPSEEAGHYAATTDKFGAYGRIVECLGCGLVYTSPRVKAQEILRGYEETKDEDYFLESEARSINAYMALATIRRHARGGRLLDVGCSAGFFLNAARLQFEVFGIEPSRWAGGFAREHLKLSGIHPTLEEARFPDAHFDVVTLIDVIEHLPDPLRLMREISRITKPGGVVYIVTPDIASLSARCLRGKWWGLRPAHIYYFSRKTLAALLEKTGYEVLSERSYGRIFTWQYWLSRLSNYPRFVRRSVEAFIRALGIQDKFLYLDTRDSVQMVARKRS